MPFKPVDRKPDLPALERRVLERWREREVVRRALAGPPGAPAFRCYEGPPTANGTPGVHHVEARVFKDAFPRYLTMKGHAVPRRAGWDCHGLPVELQIERELGLTGKPQIEQYGVGEFNALCREAVTRHVGRFEDLTRRIAYWVDFDEAYWTMSPEYVDSVWWSLKTLHERGMVYEDHRVVPYCPRCGTGLSDHEVAQGYRTVEDPSVYVRLPLLDGPLGPGGDGLPAGARDGASLVVWTTMPWTFVVTTAAVVGPGIRYVLAEGGRAGAHLVVVAAERVTETLGPGARVLREVRHEEIVGTRYRGPFDLVGPGSPADPDGDPASWRVVVAGEFVTTDQGSGIVSIGAAFGEDDMRTAREHGLPVVNPVDRAGRFDATTGPYAGMPVRDADAPVVEALRAADLLVAGGTHRHAYPFCWRCSTPLIHYAKPSWYVATSRVADRLRETNAGVDWHPPHIRDGRYGEWLRGNVDWALSRERYWGTPLPVWRCDACAGVVVVGSRAELGARCGRDLSDLDPHRPHVDAVTFGCDCGGVCRRVPDVVDAWYDSGAMPFAQFGYPHLPDSAERFAAAFPADLVAEAIDQTRGWFYSLHALSTLLFDTGSYRRVLCLGHIVDESGRKMSTSAGNVVDPWAMVDTHGADALRWLLLVEGNPWRSRRVGDGPLRDVTRTVLLTVWNTYYFLVTYANLAGWEPGDGAPPVADRPVLDRYVLAELASVTADVDAAMAAFDATAAGRRLAAFVDDLSNWYVRCSRERFWSTGTGPRDPDGTRAALATLHTCLVTLAGLLAPFTPFLADELHDNLVGSVTPGAAPSVHLTAYPQPDGTAAAPRLVEAMALARRLVTLGRDARAAAGVGVRQPLRRATVTVPAGERDLLAEVRGVVAAELNVRTVDLAGEGSSGHAARTAVEPDFRALGRAFGPRTQAVAAAVRAGAPEEIAAALREHGRFTVDVGGEPVEVTAGQVRTVDRPVEGWHRSTDGPYAVEIDLYVDRALRLEGLARQFAHSVVALRRADLLDPTDRVGLGVAVVSDPDGQVAGMLDAHSARIVAETAATRLVLGPPGTGTGHRITLGDGIVEVTLAPG